MADLSTPLDGKPWPQERFARQAPTWAPSGVIGSPAASYSAGPAGLSFTVAGSVITAYLAQFRANARGFAYERTSAPWQTGAAAGTDTLATPPYQLNSSSNPRIDRLVLRRDLDAGTIYPFVIQGAPALSPQPPALVQNETGIWDTPLHRWQLAGNNSTAISNIVDEREWVDPAGRGGGRVATTGIPIQQTVDPGGTYTFNGPQGRRSPFIGAYMKAEMSFIARFLAGSQQQAVTVQAAFTGATAAENDHDATERIPGGSGSGEDIRLIKRTAFFICTDAAFGVGYTVLAGTGGSSIVVGNPRSFITGPYQLI